MKKLFLVLAAVGLFALNGCVGLVVPDGGYYYGQTYYAPGPVYYQYYTPPIDYRRPQGVWYPWGSIGNNPPKRNHYQNNEKRYERGYEKRDGHTKEQEKDLARERAKREKREKKR